MQRSAVDRELVEQLDHKIKLAAIEFKQIYPGIDKQATAFFQEMDTEGNLLHVIYIRPDLHLSDEDKLNQGRATKEHLLNQYKLRGRSASNLLIKGDDELPNAPRNLAVGTIAIINKTIITFIKHVQAFHASTNRIHRALAMQEDVDSLKMQVTESQTILVKKRERTQFLKSEVERKQQRAAQRAINREYRSLLVEERGIQQLISREDDAQRALQRELDQESSLEEYSDEVSHFYLDPRMLNNPQEEDNFENQNSMQLSN